MRESTNTSIQQALRKEKRTLLRRILHCLEMPMVILGFVWLGLLALELTRGLNPALEALGTAIWLIFIADFAFRLVLAPKKWTYIRRNWLTTISLLVPALRVFKLGRIVRVLRVGRAARGLRLFRILSSLNRGMRALGKAANSRRPRPLPAARALCIRCFWLRRRNALDLLHRTRCCER